MKHPAISAQVLRDIGILLAERMGLTLHSRDFDKLESVVRQRMKALCVADARDYLALLQGRSEAAATEWDAVVQDMVVGESHFFRDAGQFELLRATLLPELFERQRSSRRLRVWSIGCSTGEEPYSLAMLLDTLLPEKERWSLQIFGTDVSQRSLQAARRGIFSEYSLRGLPDELRLRYFKRVDKRWLVDERIRNAVRFEYENVLAEPSASSVDRLGEMDLIVCRNVFIYFDRSTIARAVRRISGSLRPGGYLLTGHAELVNLALDDLHTHSFPNSVVYQRQGAAVSSAFSELSFSTVAIASNPPEPKPAPRPAGKTPIEEAEALFRAGDYAAAVDAALALAQAGPPAQKFAPFLLAARAAANLGRYDAAASYAREATAADGFAVGPYYLLAHLAELQGRNEAAKEFLRKIIYLDPQFVPAYLDFGALYEHAGDAPKARRMRTSALDLLRRLPADASLSPYLEQSVGELAAAVEKLLG